MKLRLLCVGSPRPPLAEAIAGFERRIGHYFDYEAWEVGAAKGSPEEVRRREGRALRGRLPDGSRVFALTRGGKRWGSRDLAEQLEELATYGPPGAAWIIGGAFGLSEELLAAADHQVSLSDFTMPHELARLVLVEQLYRAGTILRGEPYHKEPA
ncbi:MAG: 23S rRNA (pseudouridine(1915)-N(3))-methyltransferase RlmH [Gemmatimonadota bacterium]|jgi:23S rRNA (pseudouridine1915-N3)-methyltransferase